MAWQSWLNAEIYDRFVREHPIYAWLNRQLVELADLDHARRVLDVGCGTGATTLACLARLGVEAEIVGIDASESMIDLARSQVRDPRAHFEVLRASDADRLTGSFDRVVSNAAFWQFPSAAEVFRALSPRTTAGARVVLNVPAARVVGEQAPIDPFQFALVAEIEAETGQPFQADPIRVDPSGLRRQAVEHGFVLRDSLRLEYAGRQEELMELMSIPAMIEALTPGMRPESREALLRRARERSEDRAATVVPWVYFVLEREGPAAPPVARG